MAAFRKIDFDTAASSLSPKRVAMFQVEHGGFRRRDVGELGTAYVTSSGRGRLYTVEWASPGLDLEFTA